MKNFIKTLRQFINKNYLFSWWLSYTIFALYIDFTIPSWVSAWIMLGIFTIGMIILLIDNYFFGFDLGDWFGTDKDIKAMWRQLWR